MTNPASSTTRPEQTMFVDWPRSRQAWESVGGALVTGLVAGVALGLAWWAYVVAVLVALVGGAPAGSQHHTVRGALVRGFLAGTIWASSVLVASTVSDRTPTIAFPDPSLVYLGYGIVPSCVVCLLGWFLARRRRAA